MRRKWVLAAGVSGGLVVLALLSWALGLTAVGPLTPSAEDLGPAPDFTVKILDGKKVSLRDFRGKPVVVNFWASWCPPCREETPDLVSVAKQYKGKVEFLGIVYQDTVANVRTFIGEFDIPYAIAFDRTGTAAQNYRLTGVPETFVIDAKGRLRGKWIGKIERKKLTELIDGAIEAGK